MTRVQALCELPKRTPLQQVPVLIDESLHRPGRDRALPYVGQEAARIAPSLVLPAVGSLAQVLPHQSQYGPHLLEPLACVVNACVGPRTIVGRGPQALERPLYLFVRDATETGGHRLRGVERITHSRTSYPVAHGKTYPESVLDARRGRSLR